MDRKKEMREEYFISVIDRINRYFLLMGIFYLGYFMLKQQVDKYLFLLALSNMAFALLSVKHLQFTMSLMAELQRARVALDEKAEEHEIKE